MIRVHERPFAAALALALGACNGDHADAVPALPPAPAATDPLLTVDGVSITFGELQDYVVWLDALSPEVSVRVKMRKVLDELLLPLRFAQRDFAGKRPMLRQLAQTLAGNAGNVVELEQLAGKHFHVRKQVIRDQVELPIARFLFDPLKVGAVSAPIELPQGYVVAGSFDLQEGGTAAADRCDALQVAFYTHDAGGWQQWLTALKQRLADKVGYVHPDYRDAIPPWLRLP